MIFIFYMAHIRKKFIWAPGPTECDNFKTFSPFTIAGLYSKISQSFMLLPTREIRKLVIFIFYIGHIRKNSLFGPRAPESVNFKILFAPFRYESVLNNFPKFHASTYMGR